MPLSEREKRILEDIERGLSEEDPEFAREARRRSPLFGSDRRQIKVGIWITAFGVVLLLAFFATSNVLIGVLAFGGMVGGIVVAAGGLSWLLSPRRFADSDARRRLSSTARSWEERVRKRYRRR